jgi:hypothetical protein
LRVAWFARWDARLVLLHSIHITRRAREETTPIHASASLILAQVE